MRDGRFAALQCAHASTSALHAIKGLENFREDSFVGRDSSTIERRNLPFLIFLSVVHEQTRTRELERFRYYFSSTLQLNCHRTSMLGAEIDLALGRAKP